MIALTHNCSRKTNIPIRYFDLSFWRSPLSFIYEIKEDYGIFRQGDKAVFVPLEITKDSPRDEAIIIVNNRVGVFGTCYSHSNTCLLNRLDNGELIFSWPRFDNKYQIKGLFTGILKYKNLED